MSRLSHLVKTKGVRTAIPIAALALASDVNGAGNTRPTVTEESESSESAIFTKTALSISAAATPTRISIQMDDWNDKLERRFLALAKKDALSKANADEVAELEQLEQLRNRLKSPMKFDELVWNAQHEEATQKLLSAMQEYLTFCTGPSWASATRNR